MFRSFWSALCRCKKLQDDEMTSKLSRCLNLVDLTALGVGSTLGLGVYVLAGAVAKSVAGPAVCISFLVAAIASAFAGLCYAEFAARVPKAGSAYVYSYVSVGEFVGFTIGWNLILEYVISTASVAKGTANYIDFLCNNSLKNAMLQAAPIRVSFLTDYPDFLAFAFVIIVSGLLAMGVKESTYLNNLFTLLNLLTVVIVVVAGSILSDVSNWSIDVESLPAADRPLAGAGGFLPFGMAGVMAGAAKCFFGFVGFDCVATTGEEAKNPQRNIPLSILLSLFIIFVAYFSMSTVITMMWPYYLQDADAPFPHAFNEVGMPVVKWIVTIGAIFALCTSLLGSMFPLPRVLYAMGSDGVLFRFLANVNSRTKTPMLATLISGIFAAIMAALFNLDQLIEMLSIGTLLAYTIVAISVLILRYEEDADADSLASSEMTKFPETMHTVMRQAFNLDAVRFPTKLSANIAKCSIFMFFALSLATCTVLAWGAHMALAAVPGVLLIVLVLVLQIQPRQDVTKLHFTVPLIPLLPCLSVFINLYLMVQLDKATWIRFCIWLAIGYSIYFCYGIRNSSLSVEKVSCKTSERSVTTININKKEGKKDICTKL